MMNATLSDFMFSTLYCLRLASDSHSTNRAQELGENVIKTISYYCHWLWSRRPGLPKFHASGAVWSRLFASIDVFLEISTDNRQPMSTLFSLSRADVTTRLVVLQEKPTNLNQSQSRLEEEIPNSRGLSIFSIFEPGVFNERAGANAFFQSVWSTSRPYA